MLYHTMELSFYPNWKGLEQKRVISLEMGNHWKEDILILTSDGPMTLLVCLILIFDFFQ